VLAHLEVVDGPGRFVHALPLPVKVKRSWLVISYENLIEACNRAAQAHHHGLTALQTRGGLLCWVRAWRQFLRM
jgi:hypothetical protein